jgi:PPOX class probable F420-dependent enzyme
VAPEFSQLKKQRYLSLASFRKSGEEVRTPLWFAEQNGTLFVMTRDDSWKYKRIRNNPQVRVAPCTARGRVTGAWSDAVARVLPREAEAPARAALQSKYWLLRIPWLWSKKNVFIALTSR